jgi:hypothetical protein
MRYATGEPQSQSPVLTGAKLVGAGVGAFAHGAPALVSRGIDSGPLAISGFGSLGDDTITVPADTDATATPGWLTSIIGAGTQVENVLAQAQLNQINIQRAAQGLAPLPSSVVGPTATVGLSSDTQNLLIYGALGFAALFLLSKALR